MPVSWAIHNETQLALRRNDFNLESDENLINNSGYCFIFSLSDIDFDECAEHKKNTLT